MELLKELIEATMLSKIAINPSPGRYPQKRYDVGDVITSGAYKGFVVLKVTPGWYQMYHPSNIKDDPNLRFANRTYRGRGKQWEKASVKIRWSWI